MSQRAPSLVSDTHYCVVGDVTIDVTAAIAAGVVLQASTGSRIVVGKGVCLAAGVCIQSRKGILTIESGASLGANVLVVGNGTVGANACISAGTTLINPAVEAEAILPPDTLISAHMSAKTGAKQTQSSPSGFETSRFDPSSNSASSFTHGSAQPAPVAAQATLFQASTFVEPEPIAPKPIQIPDIPQQPNQFVSPLPLNQPFSQPFNQSSGSGGSSGSFSSGSLSNNVQSDYGNGRGNGGNSNQANGSSSFQNGSASGSSSLTVPASSDRVYGRDQVSQLVATLFPHRQPLDNHSQS